MTTTNERAESWGYTEINLSIGRQNRGFEARTDPLKYDFRIRLNDPGAIQRSARTDPLKYDFRIRLNDFIFPSPTSIEVFFL
jgi:hypothetical protein